MIVGKWHLGDQPEFLPTRHGFDHFFGLPYSNNMDGTGKPYEGPNAMPPLPLLRDETVIEAPPDQTTLTRRYTEEAVGFITANKDRPFFLYLPHTAVHAPVRPGAAFQGVSQNGAYGDWVEEMDWSVGRVLDTIRQLSLGGNTLVLFTSDNGGTVNGHSNAPLRGKKGSTWEGGMRVPTIAWWPGQIAAGSVNHSLASVVDLLPTITRLAGGSVPATPKIDGVDILPVLSGQGGTSPREALFYFLWGSLEAVRAGSWKLVVADQMDGTLTVPASITAPRLYNLDNDIGETSNVAGANPAVVQQLQNRITSMAADLGMDKSAAPGQRAAGNVANPVPLLLPDPGIISQVRIVSPGTGSVTLPQAGQRLGLAVEAVFNFSPPPREITHLWSSSPPGVVFDPTDAPSTGAYFPDTGDFTLRVAATCRGLNLSAEITVRSGAVNGLPAGALVARYGFDDGSGTTVADVTGNFHNGLIGGTPLWNPSGGKYNGALEFRANTDRVAIPDHENINTKDLDRRTVALWFKTTQLPAPTGYQFLFEEGGTMKGLNLYLDSGKLVAGAWGDKYGWINNPATFLTTATAPSPGQWHHAAFVLETTANFAPGNFRAYLDGVLYASGPAATVPAHADDTGIGGMTGNSRTSVGNVSQGNYAFKGLIDEVVIYNRALSAAEIAALAAGRGNLPPQVDAGADRTVAFTAGVNLLGTAGDDGLPTTTPPATQWTQINGPGNVVFSDPAALSTWANFSLPGVYQLRLTADDGNLRGWEDATVNVSPLTYAEWIALRPTPPVNPGPMADSDADTLPNLVEFALGLDPSRPDSLAEVLSFSSDGTSSSQRVRFAFIRPRDRNPQIVLEQSANLAPWTAVTAVPAREIMPDGREQVTYTLDFPKSINRQFLRLSTRE